MKKFLRKKLVKICIFFLSLIQLTFTIIATPILIFNVSIEKILKNIRNFLRAGRTRFIQFSRS